MIFSSLQWWQIQNSNSSAHAIKLIIQISKGIAMSLGFKPKIDDCKEPINPLSYDSSQKQLTNVLVYLHAY